MRRLIPGFIWGAVIAAATLVAAVVLAMQTGSVVTSTSTYTVTSRTVQAPGRWELPVGVRPQAIVSPVRAMLLPVMSRTPAPGN
jgi:hypothetical protein